MDPEWDPKWTPFYHLPLRDAPVLFRKGLCFTRPGALFEHPGCPQMGLRMEPKLIPNGFQMGPKMEPKMDPQWIRNGPQNGPKMDPKLTPNGTQNGSISIIYHSVNLTCFLGNGFVLQGLGLFSSIQGIPKWVSEWSQNNPKWVPKWTLNGTQN